MNPHFMFNNWCWIPIVFCILFMVGFGRRRYFGPWGMQDRDNDNYEKRSAESALDVLNKRYAKGEITKEEYLDIKSTLMR